MTRSIGLAAALVLAASMTPASEPASGSANDEPAARRAAVAINYCRSSFYRIRQSPTADVLAQERQKILNNLNLSSVNDEEVVKLYSGVVDEIGQVRIADRERQVVATSYDRGWQSLATFTAFSAAVDAVDMNYLSLARRGASSWWDFRGLQINRDVELWKVEKSRMTTINEKSTGFLDASWRLARKRNIPDEWLIRDTDLERLDIALREQDPEVRLRLLARMEPFMQCYPPYWYYVARTQQQLGRLIEADETYRRLATIGDGFFRRDEMLAGAMANAAVIRDYLKLADAAEAAEQALRHTTDAWEVNLAAGMVLMRHGRLAAAEDAVLRNLDAHLETDQSSVALLAVYAKEGDPKKILARLGDPALVARTPVPILLRCAAALQGHSLPHPVAERLAASLHGHFERGDFVLAADPSWEFRTAMFAVDESIYSRPTLHAGDRTVMVRFCRRPEAPRSADLVAQEFDVLFKYADDFQVKLSLRRNGSPHVATKPTIPRFGNFLSFKTDHHDEPATGAPPRDSLRVASVETCGTLIALDGPTRVIAATPRPTGPPTELATSPPSQKGIPTLPVSTPARPRIDAQPAAISFGIVEPETDDPPLHNTRPDADRPTP